MRFDNKANVTLIVYSLFITLLGLIIKIDNLWLYTGCVIAFALGVSTWLFLDGITNDKRKVLELETHRLENKLLELKVTHKEKHLGLVHD